MSSVQVLLSKLEDAARCSSSRAERASAVLAELLALCRHDERKSEVARTGTDVLLALATAISQLPAASNVLVSDDDDDDGGGDALAALLELLLALMLDAPAVRARLVQRGVLEVAVRALRGSCEQRSTKRRSRLVRLALDVVDQWSCCCCSSSSSNSGSACQSAGREAVVGILLRLVSNPQEDATVLLHAAEVLGYMLERDTSSIQAVASLGGVTALLQLLQAAGENMDVKRSACEALLIMSDAVGMIQAMALANAIRALRTCLQTQIPGRDVESVVVRLLLRLSEGAQVYGQIIDEGVLPLLFQVLDRNCNLLEIAAPVCTILDRVSSFARDCKLDLSPYVQEAGCRGKVMINAATCNIHAGNVTQSVFRFFVQISRNPVDMPLLVNSESIEGLLALYISTGGSGGLAVLSTDLVQILSSLSRSTLESITLKDDDRSLPSMFLCLRNHYDNLRFSSQVFALLAKYWKEQTKSVHSITGFVGIAVDILCRYAASNLALSDEMVEIYNFVRTVLLSKDGVDVVLSCGGKVLFDTLSALNSAPNQQPPSASLSSGLSSTGGDSRRCTREPSLSSLQIASGISRIVGALQALLKDAVGAGGADTHAFSVSRRNRDGDQEYEEYVTALLRRERSCLFKALESESLKSNASRISITDQCASRIDITSSRLVLGGAGIRGSVSDDDASDSDGNTCEPVQCDEPDDSVADDDDEAEADNDGNDDGSDGDGSDADEGIVNIDLELEPLGDGNQEVVCDGLKVCADPDITIQTDLANDRMKLSPSKTFAVKGWSTNVEFSRYEDKSFFFLSLSGIRYPKHPSRSKTSLRSIGDDDEASALGKTMPCEPCEAPNPAAMSAFIEQATLRRAQFLQSDPVTRAKLVYDSKSHFENLASAPGSSSSPPQSVKPEAYPYFVSEKSGQLQGSEDSLTFDSCFESGNLARAVQIGEWEYDLFLRRDFNTTGHMQWFYFAVSNICARESAPIKYRFNIVNLCKPDSLFNQGLQPVVYSVKDACEKQIGWRRSGTEIYYFSNPFPRSSKNSAKPAAINNDGGADSGSANQTASFTETYYTLTFTLEFENTEDTYLVAHSYPYTLSDHLAHLETISARLGKTCSSIIRRSVLCKTLGGRECELLSISDFSASTQEQKTRRTAVISSRVHPGEAQASWMMRGIIDFLVGDSLVARMLRRIFLFQIIPMLNPDGVYYGNSRCSLAACDLNRVWHKPSQIYHPTIFYMKELLRKEYSSRGLVFFCDLHGHSRKKNVFVYGCDTKKRPNSRARVFAKLLSMQQTAKRYISLRDCSFKISKSKETTARVVVANELKLCWCFTLEASFCGGNFGALQGMHYNTQHMQQVGSSLCETLFSACVCDGGVRERLSSMVDDYSVNAAAYVDSTLRDGGIVCDSSGTPVGGARESSIPTPRKAKAAGNALRRPSDPATLATKGSHRKSSSSKSVLKQQGSAKFQKQASSRDSERKRSQDSRQSCPNILSSKEVVETRRASVDLMSPRMHILDGGSDVLDRSTLPRAKMSGRKLKNKKKKAKKKPAAHRESSEPAQDEMPRLPACSASLVHDGDDTPTANAGRCVSNSCNGPVSPSLSSLPMKPATCAPASKSPVGTSIRGSTGCLQLTDSIVTLLSKSSVAALPNAFGVDPQSREASSVIFPPPIGDLMSRSPKAKSSSVRFRGGGRQFAVVNPLHQKNLKDIMRFEATQYVAYDQDLLSASTMAIRQRATVSTSNNSPQPRPSKLASPAAGSPYLSFPNVT